ncbi:MAG TPA: TIGR00341 family protein, partial [Coriobacteriia bacterium]|nr:TIGR00341 family protein [Coriobacteriia bacterium]
VQRRVRGASMSLRLLEFAVPKDQADAVIASLEEQQIHHLWTSPSGESSTMIRILLDAESVEAVSDVLADRLGHHNESRMVLLPVEATIPRIEPQGPGDEEEGQQGESEAESKEKALRIGREELYEDLAFGTRLTGAYATMVALSTVVAAVGLVRDDVAIIIGAMVIAPLLGPNIALSFGAILGDTGLIRRSLKTLGAGFAIAVAISFGLGLVLPVNPATPEIAARTSATFGNIALALAAGAAGSLAFTTGVPAALVGVMVAVALLPPLTSAGLLAGAGAWYASRGALLLLLTNIAAINLAAMATFLVQRVRPRTWWEAERAKKAWRIALAVWLITLLVLALLIAFGQVGNV